MTGSDVVVFEPGSSTVTDRFATMQATPAVDAQQDLQDVSSSLVGGEARFAFTRAYTTSDTKDNVIGLGQIPIVYARGSSTSISYHDSGRGTVQLTLCAASTSTSAAPTTSTTAAAAGAASLLDSDYAQSATLTTGLTLRWTCQATSIAVLVVSENAGWTGVGFAGLSGGRGTRTHALLSPRLADSWGF
jgi:hypothetical protein